MLCSPEAIFVLSIAITRVSSAVLDFSVRSWFMPIKDLLVHCAIESDYHCAAERYVWKTLKTSKKYKDFLEYKEGQSERLNLSSHLSNLFEELLLQWSGYKAGSLSNRFKAPGPVNLHISGQKLGFDKGGSYCYSCGLMFKGALQCRKWPL